MNTQDYLAEGFKQLGDERFYRKLDHDPTQQYLEEANQLFDSMLTADVITDKDHKYLVNHNPRTARFYLLPKIHKPGNPGRPIVSAVNSPTEKPSEFVERYIHKYADKLPSHIKDTNHFITAIPVILARISIATVGITNCFNILLQLVE